MRTQNCGVFVLGENDKDSDNLDNDGVQTYVIDLELVMDKRVVLFWCNWFVVYDEIKGVKKDENDFVSVNTSRFFKTNEPFILANQASQVFYANDNSNKGWQVVRKTQPRDSFDIVEQMDDDIVYLGSSSKRKEKELMRLINISYDLVYSSINVMMAKFPFSTLLNIFRFNF